ncbi:hypothetical protein VSH64_06770 [Amycolatopsis rhabdoformis]|uniref:Uncharacterized protein n=1 Tax=Amycolatopsis rhabdoformis TaxID=1448059 RepID=A0ABZ1ICP1_9PSEU|nr:hypothetical protein [Amycolatopsis rhabdoformis]WSE31809.1 hypothetical protein VSH64_06770 [Amycolatopsis rhabdoformis]
MNDERPTPDRVVGLGAVALRAGWWASAPLRRVGWAVLTTAVPEEVARRALRDVVTAAAGVVLDSVDVAKLVGEHVDLDAVLAEIDLAAVVARLDFGALVAAMDLPEVVRQSSGTVAGEAIQGVRGAGASADDTVTRVVERVLRRRGDRPA